MCVHVRSSRAKREESPFKGIDEYSTTRAFCCGAFRTFEKGQSLQLDVLVVPVPGAALRLLGLLLERPLGEGVDPIDEGRRRHCVQDIPCVSDSLSSNIYTGVSHSRAQSHSISPLKGRRQIVYTLVGIIYPVLIDGLFMNDF